MTIFPQVEHRLVNKSCLDLDHYINHSSVDLILTSPPYADLLHKVAENFAGYTYEKNIYRDQGRDLATPYSDIPEDFGNMGWQDYLKNIGLLMRKLYDAARPGSFNVWVIRDFRDVENHIPYVGIKTQTQAPKQYQNIAIFRNIKFAFDLNNLNFF